MNHEENKELLDNVQALEQRIIDLEEHTASLSQENAHIRRLLTTAAADKATVKEEFNHLRNEAKAKKKSLKDRLPKGFSITFPVPKFEMYKASWGNRKPQATYKDGFDAIRAKDELESAADKILRKEPEDSYLTREPGDPPVDDSHVFDDSRGR